MLPLRSSNASFWSKTLHASMDLIEDAWPDSRYDAQRTSKGMNVDRARIGALLATLAVLIPHHALGQSAELPKRSITIISSFGPGGGYSIYADLLARHLGKHLAGSPTVTVRNMPGAGGLNGTNYLYNVAPRDGSVLGIIPQTVAIAQALGAAQVRYDVRQFNWIGRLNSNVEVQQSWYTSRVRKIEDAKAEPIVVAGTGPDSSS